ncbi:MAG TPA: histidine kinase, partial [Ramlibacter sp.]|nr:histidine kinase [Ramlibacter sp.]
MSALPLPDLAQCASEPIRVPGAIQPHGRMAVLDAGSGRLLAFSANWTSEDAVREALAALPVDSGRLQAGTGPSWVGTLSARGSSFDVAAHLAGDRAIVEYEPPAPGAGLRAPIYAVARDLLPLLQQAGSVAALCQAVAQEMKRLTGFGRCLVYRFDADGNGEVLAERLDAGYHSYAGHRFPASDVPAQARELYRVNQIRVIPDATYVPVPLLPAAGAPG